MYNYVPTREESRKYSDFPLIFQFLHESHLTTCCELGEKVENPKEVKEKSTEQKQKTNCLLHSNFQQLSNEQYTSDLQYHF